MRMMLTAHKPFALEWRELSCCSFRNNEVASAVRSNAGPMDLELASKQQFSYQLLERDSIGGELFKVQHRNIMIH
jgi:hypothetical protein